MSQPATPQHEALNRMASGLVVSCQAPPGSPLRRPDCMALMAQAAELSGASGIRANGPADIEAIRNAVSIPVLGLFKVEHPGSSVYITPTIAEVDELLAVGCNLIALDATNRPRPDGVTLDEMVRHIHQAGALAFADIASPGDIDGAIAAGADAIGTTLSGYTGTEPPPPGPDFDLVRELAGRLSIPVYAEGRYSTPDQIATAQDLGASFVVVGTAITDPVALTRKLSSPFQVSEQDR